jgi:glucosamine--fructose-6-phosphate aminotransferase (isomerizing)
VTSGPEERFAGAAFRAEILEQPRALERLLERRETIRAAAAVLAERGRYVRVVAHGSSDNAAAYGVYALALLGGLSAFRDSISLRVYYGCEEDLAGAAVIALSQSGRTPDVVEYVERARARGAAVVALTNDPASELAGSADVVVDLAAGPELAVAATKSYMNQLAALALLGAEIRGRGDEIADGLRRVAVLLADSVPALEPLALEAALAFAWIGRMFVVGRGLELATAREVALKLMETCRVAAEPLTATDLVHGPVAALDPLFPVWAIASRDEALPAVVEAASRVRQAGATLVASGNAASELAGAAHVLPVPEAPHAVLAPLLSVLPGQLFAAALARARGLDPDAPAGLTKVTLAP